VPALGAASTPLPHAINNATRTLDDRRAPGGNWTTRGYANSRTGQLAVSQMQPKERKLSTQSRPWHPRVDQSARCPVRELSSPRVGSPRVGVSASCPVTRLERSVTDYKDITDSPVLPVRTQHAVVQGFLQQPDTMRYTRRPTMQTHYLSLHRFCDNVTIMFAFINNH